MSDIDDLLAQINDALEDVSVGPDAMRCNAPAEIPRNWLERLTRRDFDEFDTHPPVTREVVVEASRTTQGARPHFVIYDEAYPIDAIVRG